MTGICLRSDIVIDGRVEYTLWGNLAMMRPKRWTVSWICWNEFGRGNCDVVCRSYICCKFMVDAELCLRWMFQNIQLEVLCFEYSSPIRFKMLNFLCNTIFLIGKLRKRRGKRKKARSKVVSSILHADSFYFIVSPADEKGFPCLWFMEYLGGNTKSEIQSHRRNA